VVLALMCMAALATTANGLLNKTDELHCLGIALPTVEAGSAEVALNEFFLGQDRDRREWTLDGTWASTNGRGVTGAGFKTLRVSEDPPRHLSLWSVQSLIVPTDWTHTARRSPSPARS